METMKTENRKPTDVPRKPADANEVPVYELRFCVRGGRDLGLDASGGISILRARPGREITYLPQRRFYRIVEQSSDPKLKAKTLYVPETWAVFEPLE